MNRLDYPPLAEGLRRRNELEEKAPSLTQSVADAEAALREAVEHEADVEADSLVHRASPRELAKAQQARAKCEEELAKAHEAANANGRLCEALRARLPSLEAAAKTEVEADFAARHKPAVKRLRAAFAEFLDANEAVRELEYEAGASGLAGVLMFSWGDFRTPRPGASLQREAAWLKTTEDYLQ